MEPIETAIPADKHHANDRMHAPLPALAHGLRDKSGRREIIHDMLRNICESFD